MNTITVNESKFADCATLLLRIGLSVGFLISRSRPIRSMGSVRATQCRVGKFLTVPGIHPHPQLVFASRNDSAAGDYHHWR
jgi:hypothetical protein